MLNARYGVLDTSAMPVRINLEHAPRPRMLGHVYTIEAVSPCYCATSQRQCVRLSS